MAKLNEYKKGKKTIRATEQAYKVIYQSQGFKPVSEKEEAPDPELEKLGIKPSGSGWYELPDGEKVQGRDNAIEAVTKDEEPEVEGDAGQEGDQ